MARFRDVKTLRKFAAAHASIHNHFNQIVTTAAATIPNRNALLLWPSGVNSPRESLTASEQPAQA